MEKRNIQIALPSLGEEEFQALREPIQSGWITQGPKVSQFEKNFKDYIGVKHALATTSCTTGLHLILAAMNIGPGDEVIVPAFTWIATANVVLHCGAKPVFVDVSKETFNMDPQQLAGTITSKTKAIVPVHLFGLCANMAEIQEIAGAIPLIEDAACAAGAAYHSKRAGNLGLAAAFSFHPRKSITTGEGGMVTTNDDELFERMNALRNHGASISEEQRHHGPKPYILPDFNLVGYNYRMTDLQGALGLVQLPKLEPFIQEREKWARFYQEQLKYIPWLRTPTIPASHRHGWQSYVCFVDENSSPMPRNDIMEKLQEWGISTRPGTHSVVHTNLYREKYGFTTEDFPNAWACDQQSIAIPLHNRMSEEDYHYVVSCLQRIK